MASTEGPAARATADRPPSSSWRRRAVALGAALVLTALVVTGCSWLNVTATATGPERTGQTNTTTTEATSTPATGKAVGAKATDGTSSGARAEATVPSGEEIEASSRVTEASIEPGSCATVTYTPDTASTGQVGDLCVPQHQTHTTAIVLVHGGGGTGGSRADLAAWQRRYSELGYVTFSIDYRLSDPDTDNGVWPEPEQDVKAAIQFIRLAGSTLDTSKVIVQGHSAGARLGGVVLTTPDEEVFQGAQLWTEPSDAADGFIGFYGYYNGFQFEWDAYYGKGNAFPAQSDAESNAKQAFGPALLIAGDADSLVKASESDDFAAALTVAGKAVDLIRLEGRNHGFDMHDGQLTKDGRDMVARIQLWIAQHVESQDSAR